MPDILRNSWDGNTFLDNFENDLDEIDKINTRMDVDLQKRIKQRVRMYGKDNSKYLGIDIKMPLVTLDDLPAFPSNPYSELPAPEPAIDINDQGSFFMTQNQ